jgi:Cdc6-like AAA superfamily ATPase
MRWENSCSIELYLKKQMLTCVKSDERFMIDVPTFRKLHAENMSYVIHESVETMTPAEMEQEEPPDTAFYYLVPLQTKGFNLRTKKWVDLNMDQIGPVVWNEKAFDSLVLNKGKKTKELITALVSKQISSSKSTDVIAGKGNGLILLLHGGPGTGKTLTAEGVAELAKKPLYRVRESNACPMVEPFAKTISR